jgi:hypothetical protein
MICDPGPVGFQIVSHKDNHGEVTSFNIRPGTDSREKKCSTKGYHYEDLNVFTTNYDLCLETYCSFGEIPYLSGFDLMNKEITEERRFEEEGIRIWKMHGSIDRYITKTGELLQLPVGPRKKIEVEGELMIYPGYGKSFYREPYMSMLYELKKALRSCSVCIAIGYSFRDNAINSVFQDSLLANKRIKVVLLSPDAESIMNENASYMGDRAIPINQPFGDSESMKELKQILKRAR